MNGDLPRSPPLPPPPPTTAAAICCSRKAINCMRWLRSCMPVMVGSIPEANSMPMLRGGSCCWKCWWGKPAAPAVEEEGKWGGKRL
jgi:hypothetical protein